MNIQQQLDQHAAILTGLVAKARVDLAKAGTPGARQKAQKELDRLSTILELTIGAKGSPNAR